MCPVRAECLELSLRHSSTMGRPGIWGGLVEADRAAARRRWLAGTEVTAGCGRSGRMPHLRAGEDTHPSQATLEAWRPPEQRGSNRCAGPSSAEIGGDLKVNRLHSARYVAPGQLTAHMP
jgi:hypothetical protein